MSLHLLNPPTSKKVDTQTTISDAIPDDSNGGDSDKTTSDKVTHTLELPIGTLILRNKWIKKEELTKDGRQQFEQIETIECFLQTISGNGYKNKSQMKSSDLTDLYSFLNEKVEFIKEFDAQESIKKAETLGVMG